MSSLFTFELKSRKDKEFISISSEIKNFIKESRVRNGIGVIYTPHTTAGITINENADPDVLLDIEEFIQKTIPRERYFRHMEGNSDSHIMSSFFGCNQNIIINDGEMVSGTWQGIYFCEFDGPRTRKVYFKIIEG